MPTFNTVPRGVTIEFDEQEADLLRRLFDEMLGLLESNAGPDDPVIDRLFPEAYEGRDPDAENDFKRYAGSELERMKLDGLRDAAEILGPDGAGTVMLNAEMATAWLALLTDMRLAIGTRLKVDEEKMSAPLDPRDPESPALGVLHWLGWVQEEILDRLPSRPS